jgi:hypothetical protein
VEDEAKIRDVIMELDNSCPICSHRTTSTVHDYPDKSKICSKHLLENYNDFRAGEQRLSFWERFCKNCCEIIKEVEYRGLGGRPN